MAVLKRQRVCATIFDRASDRRKQPKHEDAGGDEQAVQCGGGGDFHPRKRKHDAVRIQSRQEERRPDRPRHDSDRIQLRQEERQSNREDCNKQQREPQQEVQDRPDRRHHQEDRLQDKRKHEIEQLKEQYLKSRPPKKRFLKPSDELRFSLDVDERYRRRWRQLPDSSNLPSPTRRDAIQAAYSHANAATAASLDARRYDSCT